MTKMFDQMPLLIF